MSAHKAGFLLCEFFQWQKRRDFEVTRALFLKSFELTKEAGEIFSIYNRRVKP
jgi:hypothetical protein